MRQTSGLNPWSGLLSEEDDDIKTLEDVRAQPVSLRRRRRLRDMLEARQASAQAGERGASAKATFKETRKRTSKFLDFFRPHLWQRTIWKIESQYGSAVSSFFNFLKWTMGLNVVTTIFVLFLIVTPQLVEDDRAGRSDPGSLPLDSDCQIGHTELPSEQYWVPEANASLCCSLGYQNSTSDLDFDTGDFFNSLLSFFSDLFQGTNWMADSPLFYGYYSGTFVFQSLGVVFDFPMAYLLVMISAFLVNLLAVVFSSAKSFHANYAAIQSEECRFNNLVFGAWDSRITNEKSVAIQKTGLRTRMTEALKLQAKEDKRKNMGTGDKVKLYLVRVLVNVFVLASLAGALWTVFYITGTGQRELLEKNECKADGNDVFDASTWLCFFLTYLPSVVITVLNMVLPFAYTWLVALEDYSPNTELVLNLARSITLRMLTLVITFISVYSSVECNYALGCLDARGGLVQQDENGDCPFPEDVEIQSCSNTAIGKPYASCRKPICWETEMGQTFYQLTFVDFFVQILMVFLFDLPRTKLIGLCDCSSSRLGALLGDIEFNISKNVLDIVFSQTICWLAIFFSPLISFVTLVKFYVLFYVRIFYVFHVSRESYLFGEFFGLIMNH